MANTSFSFPTISPPKAEEEFDLTGDNGPSDIEVSGDGVGLQAPNTPVGLTPQGDGGLAPPSITPPGGAAASITPPTPDAPPGGHAAGPSGSNPRDIPPGGTQPSGPTNQDTSPSGGWSGDGSFWSQYVDQASDLIDRQLAEAREEGMARLDERMASRGLTGSSIGAEQAAELEQNLQTQRMQRMVGLEKFMRQLEQERQLTTRGQDIRERLADQDQRMQALNQILRILGSVGLEPLTENLEG